MEVKRIKITNMKCSTNLPKQVYDFKCSDKPMIKPIENWVFKNGECYLNVSFMVKS